MTKLDALLYEFYVIESGMPVGEFNLLTEDMKTESIIEIANEVLQSIKKKLSDIDTLCIDRSRGDIRNFQELKILQDTITKLANLAFSSKDIVNPKLPQYLKEITTAITNINKYSAQYKEAYRSKKTLMILNYQAIILSIIASLSYLVSANVDFKDANIKLKPNAEIVEILPLKSIIEYNRAVDNGFVNEMFKDSALLREFFIEYTPEQLSTIYEATDIIGMINSGIDAFTSFIDNPNRNGIIFKVLGIVMVILSLRDIFYTLSNSRTEIMEKIQSLKTFLNIDKLPSTSALTRFITFNNKNVSDAIYTSNTAEKEISAENREISYNAKAKESAFDATSSDFIPTKLKSDSDTNPPTENIFADFAF